MELSEAKRKSEIDETTQILDRGIDDMESGRELILDDAFDLIAELVETHRYYEYTYPEINFF